MLPLTVAVLSLFACAVVAQNCGTTLTWSIGNGNMLLNGQPFVLKGVNFFGFETDTFAPHGLWGGASSLDVMLDIVKNNNFNAIRLPFSMELALTNPGNPTVDCGSNPTICNLNALDLMEAFIDR
uniref:Glycoside hydrolase family 5 domain-containing protein n=1 Tax=Plectus sambesii TaxID=2011161 RepID=A0A914XPK6_9BILA